MLKEVPKILCVTRAILCEKFKVNGAVARGLIRELTKRNLL
jgi:ribosomal protein S25